MSTARFRIDARGHTVAIYGDRLRSVFNAIGTPVIMRASAVEPNEHGEWVADLRPVGGPVLSPCRNRAEALAAEVAWLDAHLREINAAMACKGTQYMRI